MSNGDNNNTSTINPILAAFAAKINAKLAATSNREARMEGERAKRAAFSLGERARRHKLRQVGALASCQDLLLLAGDQRAEHLRAVRSWLTSLGHGGSFSLPDTATLLDAGEHPQDEYALLIALSVGEPRSEEAGELASLACVARRLQDSADVVVPSKAAAPEKGDHRKRAGALAQRQVQGLTSGAGDDEDLTDQGEEAEEEPLTEGTSEE